MPELGGLEEKATAALSGLAPMSRRSGRWTGRAFITGGEHRPPRTLHASLVACLFNPDLKAAYDLLIKA
ncbi:hypothetical protein QE369_001086 [Agrobacterium larrymoorei]|uniref:Uncharacterized protein n=1 Tax=Agrobacterium larrymoorei TaxID=160699 RepID=A0AAJ2BBI7_9HYPH|nr:hypothetical protein [Agrobacterium larrymoorei]MDR6100908.1 hypothetical protein [Agrobacterium larrymoorei]